MQLSSHGGESSFPLLSLLKLLLVPPLPGLTAMLRCPCDREYREDVRAWNCSHLQGHVALDARPAPVGPMLSPVVESLQNEYMTLHEENLVEQFRHKDEFKITVVATIFFTGRGSENILESRPCSSCLCYPSRLASAGPPYLPWPLAGRVQQPHPGCT